MASLANNSRLLRRDVDALNTRVTNVSSTITDQLQKGEARAAKSWVNIVKIDIAVVFIGSNNLSISIQILKLT